MVETVVNGRDPSRVQIELAGDLLGVVDNAFRLVCFDVGQSVQDPSAKLDIARATTGAAVVGQALGGLVPASREVRSAESWVHWGAAFLGEARVNAGMGKGPPNRWALVWGDGLG